MEEAQKYKHINPDDIKKLDPIIEFMVTEEGQAINVTNMENEERKKRKFPKSTQHTEEIQALRKRLDSL